MAIGIVEETPKISARAMERRGQIDKFEQR